MIYQKGRASNLLFQLVATEEKENSDILLSIAKVIKKERRGETEKKALPFPLGRFGEISEITSFIVTVRVS